MHIKNLLLSLIVGTLLVQPSHAIIEAQFGDYNFFINGNFKPETFYGNGIRNLDRDSELDKMLFWRHTLDLNIGVNYGRQTCERDVANFYFTLRNKAPWGSPESILRTSSSTIKDLEAVFGEHSHAVTRNLFWMREAWVSFDLDVALYLPFANRHTLKIGAFPYQLGRGISLGDAYAVSGTLGFWEYSIVDQFAYGALLDFEVLKEFLHFELYGAILQNKSASLSEVNEKVLGQQYGRLATPARGFGNINFVTSGRLRLTALDRDLDSLNVEAYVMYNQDPEQLVEFPADARARLGTIGFAGEYVSDCFEFGWDIAKNIGNQFVKGWDRNRITHQNRDGFVALVNSSVRIDDPVTGSNALYAPKSELFDVQSIINNAERAQSQNGKQIGVTPTGESVFNAPNRFRDPYNNKLKGWMAVADASYWILPKELQIAVTAGAASGDDNPNLETIDGDYKGFIGLQELYSGKRVRSAFLLGGAGRLQRPFTNPTDNQISDKFVNSGVSGFTNLVFVGSSLSWIAPCENTFKVNPNIIGFWQERATGNARKFLGVEANLFTNYALMKNMDFYFVGSIFIPGSHYKDRKGVVTLTPEQIEIADESDVTGFEADRIPGLNNQVAITLNLGIKYSF